MGWGGGRDLAILEHLELPNHNPGEGVIFKTMPLGGKYRVSLIVKISKFQCFKWGCETHT